MTTQELRNQIIDALSECNHVNDGSIAAHCNENIQWAWDNWEAENVAPYFKGEKPERYTTEFMEDWVNAEPFDTELEQINNPA